VVLVSAPWACCLFLALALPALAQGEPNNSRRVDPFMGTGGGAPGFGMGGASGSTFPGAVLPFGMTQFGPDTVPSATNPSGYSYPDRTIRGFSLTHFSGAGCAIYRDVPVLPTTARVDVSPAVEGSSRLNPRFMAHFDHRHESASPGTYRVILDPGSTKAIDSQLTATTRTGEARFTFPARRHGSILINPAGSANGESAASVVVDPGRRDVMGSAESGGFCSQPTKYRVYFVARFNRPFVAHGTWNGQSLDRGSTRAASTAQQASPRVQVGAYVTFDTHVTRTVEMQVGVSFTSVAEARRNLATEVGRRTFESIRSVAQHAWRTELAKVTVSGGTASERRVFYTSLYHALIEPSTFSDVDGSYVGMDGRVHNAGPVTQYTNISGWDVYRSQIPLVAMLEPQRAEDLAASIVRDAQQSRCLPRWPYADQQTNVQVGDPSDSILAEIYAFGARRFNARAALRRMVAGASARCHSINGDYTEREGLSDYVRLGYVPQELNTDVAGHTRGERDYAWGSAATTLEYAIADSTIARLAASLGERTIAGRFQRRAQNWSRLFDPGSGYIRPRYRSGQWLTPYDPTDMTDFVEGDGAQYTWLVPEDPAGLIRRMGGDAAAASRLDRFFRQLNSGPSAQYAYLGNEPTLGVPWIYDWLGRPARATDVIRRALIDLYTPSPAGMPGNDDGGTMSAWWVFGALGLYPAVPGADLLVLNGPLFQRATISLPRGRLILDAQGLSDGRRYVQSARLDGRRLTRTWVSFDSIRRGSHHLLLRMGASSRSTWGTSRMSRPPSG
jgi:predicted alpha-1,2-mannosidase